MVDELAPGPAPLGDAVLGEDVLPEVVEDPVRDLAWRGAAGHGADAVRVVRRRDPGVLRARLPPVRVVVVVAAAVERANKRGREALPRRDRDRVLRPARRVGHRRLVSGTAVELREVEAVLRGGADPPAVERDGVRALGATGGRPRDRDRVLAAGRDAEVEARGRLSSGSRRRSRGRGGRGRRRRRRGRRGRGRRDGRRGRRCSRRGRRCGRRRRRRCGRRGRRRCGRRGRRRCGRRRGCRGRRGACRGGRRVARSRSRAAEADAEADRQADGHDRQRGRRADHAAAEWCLHGSKPPPSCSVGRDPRRRPQNRTATAAGRAGTLERATSAATLGASEPPHERRLSDEAATMTGLPGNPVSKS